MDLKQTRALKRSIKAANDNGFFAYKIEMEAHFSRPEGDTITLDCETCDRGGQVACEATHSEGVSCECANTLRVSCSNCGGRGYTRERVQGWDLSRVGNFVKRHVSAEAKAATIFMKTYNDGSVDTEITLTLPYTDPKHVEYGMEYLRAFHLLGEEIGQININRAGLHIAIIPNQEGSYPRNCYLNGRKLTNFMQSMHHLKPALLFLASHDKKSRALNFRDPRGNGEYDKYSMVNGSSGVLEYRCFQTCYDNPVALVDYMVVIGNSLKFYSDNPVVAPWFGSIGKVPLEYSNSVETLDKHFITEANLIALEKGVTLLKPSYKTFTQLKAEREFSVTKYAIRKGLTLKRSEFTSQYYEQLPRLNYRSQYQIHRRLAQWYDRAADFNETRAIEDVGTIESIEESNRVPSVVEYVQEQITNYVTGGNTACLEGV